MRNRVTKWGLELQKSTEHIENKKIKIYIKEIISIT